MAGIPFYSPIRNFYLHGTNTSTSGIEMRQIVPSRAKYVSTMVSVPTTGGGTSGFDVFAYLNALGQASTYVSTITVITSGFSVTTTSGNVTFEVGSTNTPAFIFNRGDIIGVTASTGFAGTATSWSWCHTFQEF